MNIAERNAIYRDYPDRLMLNVSGGRSSAKQVWDFVEANGGIPDGVIVNFNNTGVERWETLAFVDQLDRYLGLGTKYLEFDPPSLGKVKVVDFATAARNGEPFNALLSEILPKRKDGSSGVRPLPNPAQRSCTAQMKIKTAHRYVRKHLGWPTQYHAAIGYRADEKMRYDKRVKQDNKGYQEGGKGWFPMYLSGDTQDDVQAFWKTAPFDLGIESWLGNCDLCFMVAEWKIKERMILMAEESQIRPQIDGPVPERIARWINWEERVSDRKGGFRQDRPSYRELWDEICMGNLFSRSGNGSLGLECGACTD